MKAKGLVLGMAVASLGFLTSCEEFELDGMNNLFEDMSVTINSDYYEVEYFIPPAPAGMEIAMDSVMEIDLETMLAEEGHDISAVQSVKMLDGSLEVSEKSTIDNLAALAYINTAISTDMLGEEMIATCQSDSTAGSLLDMQTNDVELKDYLGEDGYTMTTYGMLSQATTDTLWIVCKVRYQVTVAVSGME